MSAVSSTSLSNSLCAPWVNLNPSKYTILERHKPQYTQLIMNINTGLLGDVAAIVADYVADGKVMDRQGWLEYFGVDIGEETENVKEALRFENFNKIYHGPNPVDVMEDVPAEKIRQICESCFIPVVRPQHVKWKGIVEDFCVTKLEQIAEDPLQGYSAYSKQTAAFREQHGEAKAGPSALVILLKDLVARSKFWSKESQNPKEQGQVQYLRDLNDKTQFGCKIPDILSQANVLFAHHAQTGELPWKTDPASEESYSYGCTKERVRYGNSNKHVMTSGIKHTSSGGVLSAELEIYEDYENYRNLIWYGVGVMREF